MTTAKYVYWQDEDMWIGYLEAFPDFLTQGETLEDLQEHLRDIHLEVASGSIPLVKRVGELAVA